MPNELSVEVLFTPAEFEALNKRDLSESVTRRRAREVADPREFDRRHRFRFGKFAAGIHGGQGGGQKDRNHDNKWHARIARMCTCADGVSELFPEPTSHEKLRAKVSAFKRACYLQRNI